MSRSVSNLFHNISGVNISDLDFDDVQDQFDDFYEDEFNHSKNVFKFNQESLDY